MTKQRQTPEAQLFDEIPKWAKDDFQARTTPYTEEELDSLTEDTIHSFRDIPVWLRIVDRVGIVEATRILRNGIRKSQNDPGFFNPIL